MSDLLSDPVKPTKAQYAARLRERLRQAHREDAGYLTHQLMEDNLDEAGVLSLAEGEYLAGFQKQSDGTMIPIVGPENRVVAP